MWFHCCDITPHDVFAFISLLRFVLHLVLVGTWSDTLDCNPVARVPVLVRAGSRIFIFTFSKSLLKLILNTWTVFMNSVFENSTCRHFHFFKYKDSSPRTVQTSLVMMTYLMLQGLWCLLQEPNGKQNKEKRWEVWHKQFRDFWSSTHVFKEYIDLINKNKTVI